MYDYMPQGYEDERVGTNTSSSLGPYSHNNPKRIPLEDLDKLTLADYNLTPAKLKGYMFGLEIRDPQTGDPMGDTFYEDMILKAMAQVEKKLDIAIFPRLRTEHHDFNAAEYNSFVYTHVQKRPILQVEDIGLEFNGRRAYNYPAGWWKVYSLGGHIEISPTPLMMAGTGFGGATGGSFIPNLVAPLGLSQRHTFAPQMFHIKYIAGLLPRRSQMYNEDWELPADLEKLIHKVALKDIFEQWGRLLVKPGVQSTSLTIDGVTETINTTQTALYTAATAEIAQINQDIEDLMKDLRGYFGDNLVSV